MKPKKPLNNIYKRIIPNLKRLLLSSIFLSIFKKSKRSFWKFKYLLLFVILSVVFTYLKQGKIREWNFLPQAPVTSHRAYLNPKYEVFTSDEKSVYFGDYHGHVYSLNRRNGKPNWIFTTNNYSPYPINVTDPELAFVADFDGRIYALNKNNGDEKWRFAIPDLLQPDTPAFVSGEYVLVGGRDGVLYALDKQTGALRWQNKLRKIDLTKQEKNAVIIHFGMMVVDNERILVNSPDNVFYMIKRETGEIIKQIPLDKYIHETPLITSGLIILKVSDYKIIGIDKSTGSVKWTYISDEPPRGLLYSDKDSLYLVSQKGNLWAISAENGQLRWVYKTDEYIEPEPIFVQDLIFVKAIIPGQGGRIIALNQQGEKVWSFDAPGIFRDLLPTDKDVIGGGESESIYALDQKDGQLHWQTNIRGTVRSIKNIFNTNILVSAKDKVGITNLYLVDINGGKIVQEVADADIDDLTLRSVDDELYFLGYDQRRVYRFFGSKMIGPETLTKLNLPPSASPRPTPDLNHWLQAPQQISRPFSMKIKRLLKRLINTKFEVIAPEKPVSVYDVYELTIHHDESNYTNIWTDVKINSTFIHESGKKITVHGFYFDQDTWKVRFAPTVSGHWRWQTQFSTGIHNFQKQGEFDVSDNKEAKGFVRIDPKSPTSLIFDNKMPFFAIGFQDAIIDYNFDGNPINQWSSPENPPQDVTELKFIDMDNYFKYYQNGGQGFNLYRLGIDNASPRLWKTISTSGNYYGVNEGIWFDNIIQTLKAYDYRVWLSIFGFEPPLPFSIDNQENRKAIKAYLDYVVSRYGVQIDVWELMNETQVDEDWIRFVSSYIRKIDPYHHPITTNWQRPDLPEIDINSVHWYDDEYVGDVDIATRNIIGREKRWGKPVVFSEQGNKKYSWSEKSALKLRVKIWTGFLEKASFIFWNHTRGLKENLNNADIYLGQEEMAFVSVIRNVMNNVDKPLEPVDLTLQNPQIRAYSAQTPDLFLSYFYHYDIDRVATSTDFTINLPRKSKVSWIDPKTGKIIKETEYPAGDYVQTLRTPSFTEDVLLKVEFK